MIEFADQHSIIKKIARSLCDTSSPRCWCVVLPPGFADEHAIAEALANALRDDNPERLISVINADNLRTRNDYVRQLSCQWYGRPADEGTELSELLAKLTADQPGFQVLTRFHKIIRTLDQFVLGDLRDAEQSHRLRTVTLSPLRYSELKRRWKTENISFCVSDYGDKHLRADLRPPERETIHAVAQRWGAPKWLIDDLGMTIGGGYPAAVEALFDRWVAEGRPTHLLPEVKAVLRSTVEKALERLIDFLDGEGEDRFRNAVCDLYHGLNISNALYILKQHNWSEIILNSKGLRAECLGSLAEKRFALTASTSPERMRDLWRRGYDLYNAGQFQAVNRLLDRLGEESPCPHLYILRQHARIMELLYGTSFDQGDYCPNWREIIKAIKVTEGFIARFSQEIPDAEDFLLPRLGELAKIASSINAAIEAGPRYVDTLSGLFGHPEDSQGAALVMLFILEGGRRKRDHETALQKILSLPEQIFRSWAKLSLDLDYYKAPINCDDVWKKADEAWRRAAKVNTSLKRSEAGTQFHSFTSFAYFSFAFQELKCPEIPRPENDIAALQSCLSFFKSRNDSAHAVSSIDERTRLKYFNIAERWLDTLCVACTKCGSRNELIAIIEPLPLIGEDGRIT